MFAGPNRSGKSTLKSLLRPELLGVFINPDDIEQGIRSQGYLDLASYGVNVSAEEVLAVFRESSRLQEAGMGELARLVRYSGGRLDFGCGEVNSYLASVAGDLIRKKLVEMRATFTLETVMSHPSKVELLEQAQAAGYRTYLYYVATEDPAINVSRVRNRVGLGGHDVPEDKIVQRYYRSLELLWNAVRKTNRAYIFDNSGDNPDHQHTWLAEVTDGEQLVLKADRIPAWFKKAVLDKIP